MNPWMGHAAVAAGVRAVLAGVEWQAEGGHWEEAACPSCRAGQSFGEKHDADCSLALLLGRLP